MRHPMRKAVCLILFLFLGLSPPLHGENFDVRILHSAEDLPEKFCTIWGKGDLLVSDGKYLVLLGQTPRPLLYPLLNLPRSNAMGSILGFAPAGAGVVSDLSIGSPVLRIQERIFYLAYSSLKSLKDRTEADLSFKATASYKGEDGAKALVLTTYDFYYQKGRIHISSTIKNTGQRPFEDLNFSLHFWPGHCYYFSPFDRKHHPDLHFRIYQKKDHFLGWMDRNPLPPSEEEDEPQPGCLAPGEEFQRSYILLVERHSDELLQKIYGLLSRELENVTIHFKDYEGELMEIVIKDALSSGEFYRSFLKDTDSLTVLLPRGAYLVRGHFFPAVCEEFLLVEEGGKNTCILRSPPLETIKIKVTDSQGGYVPGKVTFIGLDPTKTPYFQPENPIESGRKWEAFKNSCFPPEEGLEVEVPVGTYLVFASRGPEYTLDQKVVEVLEGKKLELVFQIDKVVNTDGLVSIDPHMHTLFSDGRVCVEERIKSIVAEGVEVAVATDHNFITDYRPSLKALDLENYLTAIPGNEVTRDGLIHYNTYPLEVRKNEERNGAISPLAQEVPFLFELSRRKDPLALLQVNHPRSGHLGYFNNYSLDQESAASARIHFDTFFDMLEAMNGPYFFSSNESAIEDWLHLLNRGYYFPVVGSSDSHSIDRTEPGYSRTYVYYEGEKGKNLDWSSVAEALKKGRSFASNGPLVTFLINDTSPPGSLVTDTDGEVKVSLRVQSAPWVSVDEVRLIVNGERKIVFPVHTQGASIMKFSEEIILMLKKDAYIAAEVLGMRSLFPVLQRRADDGLLERAALPYALTNPVFIDRDGNLRFDPPWPEKIRVTSSPRRQKAVKRYGF